MTDLAAFSASFHSLRSVVGRKQVQLVFEIPQEKLASVAAFLEQDAWYGIARLTEQPAIVEKKPANREAQKAGRLSSDLVFHQFLWERKNIERCSQCGTDAAKDAAADYIRDYCGVDSRSELTPDNENWKKLQAEYELWLRI